MTFVPRERVRPLTVLLSVVSLVVVFAAAGGQVPRSAVPTAPQWVLESIPYVNVGISAAAIVTITVGWRAIRRGNVDRHRLAMVASFGLFASFLVLYLYRLVATGGPQPFPGPETVYQFVYLPVLAIHILLAIVCVPLVYYALLLAGAHSVTELRRTAHARVGRIAAALWLVSFSLGIVVFVLGHVIY
ncbi:DUF420 domain-containing protein [Salinadaptatus halalkaliphilus]|uniref:DUF420 domain-containing protein n=1 Tax=Salinadaptatus halalkaliphilus TaxID=2419781 RepID=A0A4S3TKR6_9EURY|nr:DUF420 domain-containing protein [Salinadaptatus halalkaliphilus]THE63535.1 DUF420 domain-containing protein [Salinadaptatus halalkaliphilus]